MATICDISGYSINELINIDIIRTLHQLTDWQQECLVQLRIDQVSKYYPWDNFTDMKLSLELSLIVLLLPLLVWYLILFMLYYIYKLANSKHYQLINNDISDKNNVQNIAKTTLSNLFNTKNVYVCNLFTPYIYILSSIVSFILLIYKNPINIIQYILIYQNRALQILFIAQITILCLGLCYYMSLIKSLDEYRIYVSKLQMLSNGQVELANINTSNVRSIHPSVEEIGINPVSFPREQYMNNLYIEYLLYSWNIIILIILAGLYINIWKTNNITYYTSSVALTCLIVGFIILWFTIWYPFQLLFTLDLLLFIPSSEKNSKTSFYIAMSLWCTAIVLFGTSMFYTDEYSRAFLYTNDSYVPVWYIFTPILILLQSLVILGVLYAIIQYPTQLKTSTSTGTSTSASTYNDRLDQSITSVNVEPANNSGNNVARSDNQTKSNKTTTSPHGGKKIKKIKHLSVVPAHNPNAIMKKA